MHKHHTAADTSTVCCLQTAQLAACAAQRYIWGYPLITMAYIFSRNNLAGVNKYLHAQHLIVAPLDQVIGVVTTNSDMLYSVSMLDLSKGPLVLAAPDEGQRFYVLQFNDFYTNVVGSVGLATTGSGAGQWLVLPPNYPTRLLPANYAALPKYESPTLGVWVIGRTYVDGPSEVPNVVAIQRQYTIAPVFPNVHGAPTYLTTASAVLLPLLQAANFTLRTLVDPVPLYQAITDMTAFFPPKANESFSIAQCSGLAKYYQPPCSVKAWRFLTRFKYPGDSAGKQPDQLLRLCQRKNPEPPHGYPKPADVFTYGANLGQACIAAYSKSGPLGMQLKYGWRVSSTAGMFGQRYISRAAVSYTGLGGYFGSRNLQLPAACLVTHGLLLTAPLQCFRQPR